MESPGKYLRSERESRNLTLKQASDSTKIRKLFLQAIEEDRYQLLNSPVHMKGFLKSYARYLGLDANDIVLRYQEYQESKNPSEMPESKRRKTSTKRRVCLWLFLVLAMILLLGGLIYYFSLNPVNHFLSFPEKGDPQSVSPLPSPQAVEEQEVKDE